ncbi:hypothetical protein [Aureimonas ureilytica]|nr:hypothetical protein [Aureimonas ureilytica]
MGWTNLASPDGLETDQFDTDEIIEMVARQRREDEGIMACDA